MRRFWALASVLLLAASAGASSGKSAGAECSRALPQAPSGLPAALVVTTNCGLFRLEPSRNIVYEGPWKSPVPPVARGYWMDLTWYGRLADGRLVIGRGMKELWRSQGTFPGPRKGDVDAVVLGGTELAFEFSFYRGRHSRLYIARYGESERPVARGEMPLMFTSSDELVTWRERGGALALRRVDGRLSRRLTARAVYPHVDRTANVVVFRAARRLLVFDGEHVRRLASLRKLGLSRSPTVEVLGGLVAGHDDRHLVVLDYDGRLFASTPVPTHHRGSDDGVSSSVVVNVTGTAVAYTAMQHDSGRHERVYVLRAGDQKARALFSQPLEGLYSGGCGRAAWLAWQGRWLLYGDTERQAAVVESSGEAAPIELGGLIAQLPGISDDADEAVFDIAWSS
jgi:hypothetical protein